MGISVVVDLILARGTSPRLNLILHHSKLLPAKPTFHHRATQYSPCHCAASIFLEKQDMPQHPTGSPSIPLVAL